VIDGLTENAASFPHLLVAVKPLGVFNDTFEQTLIDMVGGGKTATAAKKGSSRGSRRRMPQGCVLRSSRSQQ
jgi:hypothetical protein